MPTPINQITSIEIAVSQPISVETDSSAPAIASEIIVPGLQGPPGTGGGAGGGYTHVQSSAATTWTINHNFGYRPAVEICDSGSQEIEAEISHPTVNQTIVMLNPATAGTARLT